MTSETYLKLVPEPTPETAPYWDGLNEQRLVLQKCGECGKIRHYPRPVCDSCFSMDVTWTEATGEGKIHSWTITHHAFHPGYISELPYVLVTVDLKEGVRMQAALLADPETPFKVGLPVQLRFDRATPNLTLPVFVLDDKANAEDNQ
jgi:uncharacterized OB-fold protein